MNETKYWLWLSMVFGVGSRRIWEVMCLFQNAEDAFTALSEGNVNIVLNDRERENCGKILITDAEKAISDYRRKNIGVIGYSDKNYPIQLRHLFNPPAVLYYMGNIACLGASRTLTSVGTRNASEYSLRVCDRICGELASKNIMIISGFAVGIDIASHLAAAKRNFPTICVLGCGVDVAYPKPNVQYKEIILGSGGLFISEYPPETSPLPKNFPGRNRILAALGRVAAVFEASLKSGSLLTANLASEEGREIFVVPPADIFDSRYGGNIQLLAEGAVPLYRSGDILDCFKVGNSIDMEIRDTLNTMFTGREAGIIREGRSAKIIDFDTSDVLPRKTERKRKRSKKEAAEPETYQFGSLPQLQQNIVRELNSGKLHIDEMCSKLGITPAELLPELTELEILGIIDSLPGKMFELCQ